MRLVVNLFAFACLGFVLVLPINSLAGELDPKQQKWIKKYEKQENVPDPAKTLINEDPEPDLESGFTSLFSGENLNGWTPKGGGCKFEVSDGCIVASCVPGENSTYLCTTKADYSDFVFTCDVKWDVDCNSGVMFRAKVRDGKNSETVYGPQAELEGFSQDRGWSGGIYGQSCGGYFYPLWLKEHRKARVALKEGQWNRLTISAQGNVIKTWINGVPAAHWTDDGTYASGFFGLQMHKGQKGKVRYKNLRIKEL